MRARPLLLPIAMLFIAMLSIQFGASLAKSLFPVLGAAGATLLRLVLATLILLVIYRPWRGPSLRGSRRALLIYGASLGFMNLAFYLALERVAMGVVVAIEFLGPLAVAIGASRRPIDFAWVALAVIGLLLLLPLTQHASSIDPVGILYAVLAGTGWALYIIYGTRAGAEHGGRSVAIGMVIATVVVLPVGVVEAGSRMLAPAVLPVALAVALLSSALPYSLEMYALTRVPTRTFGVLMSVEPGLAAVAGLIMLGERLTSLQWLAIACVMLASIGSAGSSAIRDRP